MSESISLPAKSGAERRATFPAFNWWRRRLPRAAAILAPIMVFSLAFLLYQLVDTSNRLRGAEHIAQERRALLLEVLSAHQDVETGQRGYLLTGDPAFLEPFEEGSAALDRTFGQLETRTDIETTADRPLSTQLQVLETLSTAKRDFAQRTIELVRRGDQADAIALVSDGRGRRLMDGIRTGIGTMLEREETQLALLSHQSNAAIFRLRAISFSVSAILVTLLIGAGIAVWQTMLGRQRAIEALEDVSTRSAALLDSAMDGIITFLPDGRIEGFNRAAVRMFGMSEAEAQGQNIGVLYADRPADDYARDELAAMQLRAGETGTVRHGQARHTTGSEFPVDVAITIASLPDGMRYMAVVRDVSEREKVERMKQEFVATVSHELRTPLTSVAASLGLMMSGAAGEMDGRVRHLAQIAHRNSERLVRLVNDILDLQKLDGGGTDLAIRPMALAPVLERTAAEMQGFADAHAVRIEAAPLAPEAWAAVDEDRLIQLVTNLMSNAIKFSPKGGTVKLTLSEEADEIRIAVTDNGPGIPPEFHARMFTRFAQADATESKAKGGTGLGLAIVREIAERLGGRIGFESSAGRGTRFILHLPRLERERDAA